MRIDREKVIRAIDPLVLSAAPLTIGDAVPAIRFKEVRQAIKPITVGYQASGSRGESVRKAVENTAIEYLMENGFTLGRRAYGRPGEYFLR